MRAWGTGASAEVNVHISISDEMSPWDEIEDRIAQDSVGSVVAAIERTHIEEVTTPKSSGGDLYPHPTSAAVSAVMRGNRRTGTAPELRLRSLLHRSGYRFRKHFPVRAGSVLVRPDIVFTRQRRSRVCGRLLSGTAAQNTAVYQVAATPSTGRRS